MRNLLWTLVVIIWVLNIITWVTPKNINLTLSSIYVTYKLSTNYEPYDDVHNKLRYAQLYTCFNIENSKTIMNKKELIKRVWEVTTKIHPHDESILFNSSNYIMCYVYTYTIDTDFIIIRDNIEPEEKYGDIFVHELAHLVDNHKISTYEVNVGDLLKDFDSSEYTEYYSDWYHGDVISSDYQRVFLSNEDYYKSDGEVYARMSTLKSQLVSMEIMRIDDAINKEHVDKFRRISYLTLGTNAYLNNIMDYDFIVLLPLIDWSKTDILDTI